MRHGSLAARYSPGFVRLDASLGALVGVGLKVTLLFGSYGIDLDPFG